ncbi:hypothetical protein LX32DRAFT_656203 [Colletotrichum zoysiae]|uniref:Uncharacterized protein n=1 Tax=Colletotrichum zoysiae TaxID=1216348 RepID=A0AAD9M000_9PEZI|nr:hypothetical protein LX32DRAFT_656203 [Colletotrichum zoysiae]
METSVSLGEPDMVEKKTFSTGSRVSDKEDHGQIQKVTSGASAKRNPKLCRLDLLLLLAAFVGVAFFIVQTPTTTGSLSAPQRSSLKCPTYIDAAFPYDWRSSGKAEAVVGSMDLKLRFDDTGCEGPREHSLPLDSHPRTRYPSEIKQLELVGYDFNDTKRPWRGPHRPWLPHKSPVGFLRGIRDWVRKGDAVMRLKEEVLLRKTHPTNLDLWLKSMDFSHIETFLCKPGPSSRAPNGTVLAPHMSSLRSLTAYGAWAREFILALPENSLGRLAWLHSGQAGAEALPVLRRHAESLTSLDFHEPETVYRERRVMTADQIAALGLAAPNLRSVTLDIRQNGTWAWDHLEALAANYPNVENATIFYEMASDCRRQLTPSWEVAFKTQDGRKMAAELDCEGANAMAQPMLSISGASDMFEFLVEKNARGSLRNVLFYSGGWEASEGGMLWFDWVADRRSFAACRVIDDRGDVPDGVRTRARFDQGDWVMHCHDHRGRRYKTVSDVESRRNGWRYSPLAQPNDALSDHWCKLNAFYCQDLDE